MEVRRQHTLRYLLQSLHRRLAHQSHRRQPLRRPRPLVHRVCHGIFADFVHETDWLDRSHGLEEHNYIETESALVPFPFIVCK